MKTQQNHTEIFCNLDYELRLVEPIREKLCSSVRMRWPKILRLVAGYEAASVVATSTDTSLNWANDDPITKKANCKIHAYSLFHDDQSPGTSVVFDERDLIDVVSGKDRWLVKHPFGVAGKRQYYDRGAGIAGLRKWAKPHIENGLVIETRFEIEEEWSVHATIEDASTTIHGATTLLTHHSGQFLGNSVRDAAEFSAAYEPIFERIKQTGFRGPVSIDGFRGTDFGTKIERRVSDINARFSFGRLTLELQARCAHPILWWHPVKSEVTSVADDICDFDSTLTSGVMRLPEFADPGGRSDTFILVGSARSLALGLAR